MKTKIIKVSVKGPLHIVNDLPNQDSVRVKRHKNTVTAVVCDGLGSHKSSHIGSKQACKAVTEVMKQHHKIDNIESNMDKILSDIHNRWVGKLKNYNINECGTTCLFTHIRRDRILVAQLGDGAVFLGDDLAFRKDKGLYANETHSMKKTYAINKWQWKIYDRFSTNIQSLILCTDGVSEDLNINKMNAFNGWLFDLSKSILGNFTMRKELKNWSNKNNGDDKSIVYISIKEC